MTNKPESAAVEAVAWLLTGPECAEGTTPYALTRNPDDLHSLSTTWTAEALYTQSALDALRGEVAELRNALQAFQAAEAMSNYGDASDFVFPKREMRQPGNTAWGWICEKHGLGYSGGCVCCSDDYKAHQERKDREARYARNDALSAARDLARAALTKESP